MLWHSSSVIYLICVLTNPWCLQFICVWRSHHQMVVISWMPEKRKLLKSNKMSHLNGDCRRRHQSVSGTWPLECLTGNSHSSQPSHHTHVWMLVIEGLPTVVGLLAVSIWSIKHVTCLSSRLCGLRGHYLVAACLVPLLDLYVSYAHGSQRCKLEWHFGKLEQKARIGLNLTGCWRQ